MPDAPPQPPTAMPSEACPQFRGAMRHYRSLLGRGHDPAMAMAELVAYLVVLRPGLPRVLAQEQAAAVAAACGVAPRHPAQAPRALLLTLVQPARPRG